MSDFDEQAADHADAVIETLGDEGQVVFNPKGGNPFAVDAVMGSVRGAEQFTDVGQSTKLLTATVQVPRREFTAKGITELPMMATVDAYGLTGWSIRVGESEWGAVWVKIGLERETLVREWQARRAAV